MGWKCAPITPNAISGLPSFSTMAGTSVCMGRLRGAMQLGCLGSSTKPSPRLWKLTPVLAVTMPVPKSPYSELMNETAMPFSSTMEKQTVSEPAGRGMGPSSGRCFLRSMRLASLSMVASSSMCSTGTSAMSGSATKVSRMAKASRATSISRW